jgi:hypothetical protein
MILATSILFSSCNTANLPESTEEISENTETTLPADTFITTETPVFYNTVHMTPPEEADIGASLCVVMKQYHPSGYGVTMKMIEHKGYALELSVLLQNAAKTGNIIPALSDSTEWVTAESGILPAKPGTIWIETQNGIYRLTDDYRSLCRVNHHLGEGIELEMSGTLRYLITNLWSFYPYDSYVGTYQDGKLIIGHRFAAKTDMDIKVKDIHVSRREGEKSTVTVELLSSTDQTAHISLFCQQSDDNLGMGDGADVSLTAYERQTVTLSFEGWTDTQYDILLEAGNTHVRIYIKP